MTKYLKPDQSYSDFYDEITIEECRRLETAFKKQKKPKNKFKRWLHDYVHFLSLHYTKGDRYANKSATIQRWTRKDRERDETLEHVQVPTNARCPLCGGPMSFVDKDFHTVLALDRVLICMRCPICRATRFFFENGDMYTPPPPRCPRCEAIVDPTYERDGKVITTTSTCSSCHHTATNVLDLGKEYKDPLPDGDYTKDHARFCLSDKEGMEYMDTTAKLIHITNMMKEKEECEKDEAVNEEVARLQKLTAPQLETYLAPLLDRCHFNRFELHNPDVIRGSLVAAFTVQDQDGRQEYDSRKAFKDALTAALTTTNWNLMSDGVSYKLGILTGRVRGIDDDKELFELVRIRKRGKNSSHTDTLA